MVFAGCFRACWRGAGLDLAGGWRSTAWSWLVMFGLLFLLLFLHFWRKVCHSSEKKFGRYVAVQYVERDGARCGFGVLAGQILLQAFVGSL